jgi:hypothetical protein
MGDAELAESLRRRLVLVEGERELTRRFEALFDFEGEESFTEGTRHKPGQPPLEIGLTARL